MQVHYKPSFVRSLKKFPPPLREEVLEKIELFKDTKNHKQLKVHKLKGALRGYYSFSVNYRFRVVFMYEKRNTVVLLAVGDHEVYKT